MEQLLRRVELFEGLRGDDLQRLSTIGRAQRLEPEQYLFLLGDDATAFYVVARGKVDLCFPMPVRGEVKDIAIESVGEGEPLGWSALVKPYRFTLSARATQSSEVLGFPRRALFELFESDPRIGSTFFMRISELVGIRLHTFQALWARELRRLAERPAMPHV
jgi:CRP/FNR family transcriptional regulator, cyclic AMP receptor protein